jgi:polysaccharide pyruvyl transferase WcaK-like protein
MKIGILTYHHVINDGAVLQTLGHVYTLRELFPEATIEVIDYRHATIERIERREAFKALIKLKKGAISKIKKYYNFKRFVNDLLPLSKEHCQTDDTAKAVAFINRQHYDYVIVGSDEVWKILDRKYARQFPNIYWLPETLTAKRIASAASANGSNPKLLEKKEIQGKVKTIVDGFEAIAVRDQYTFDFIHRLGVSTPLYQVPDPTFGVDWKADGVKEKLQKVGVDFSRKRFALNLSSNNPEFAKASQKIQLYAIQNNIQLVGLGQYNKYCELNLSDDLNSLEWAVSYQYFDFCITDRFHSTIFSIKNKIPFLVIESEKKYPTEHKGKIVDLLSKINLIQNHFFYQSDIDFESVLKRIETNFKTNLYDYIIEDLKTQFKNHLVNSIKK